MPNLLRIGPVNNPMRVVAPMSVNGLTGTVIVRAWMPASIVRSILKSSIAE